MNRRSEQRIGVPSASLLAVASAPRSSPSRLRRETALVGAAALALYVLTLAGNHTDAEDGVRYALDVRSGNQAQLSVAPHLAYSWLDWAIYNGARGLGYAGGALGVMQAVNAIPGDRPDAPFAAAP